MTEPDEPIFDGVVNEHSTAATPTVRESIQRLVNEQPYAVLCAQGSGQPYGVLVAFACSEDLRHAVFVTPVATRKYRLLTECDKVALVIDNRPNHPDELMRIEAVTATGRTQLIQRGSEFDWSAELLVSRHPYLKSFAAAPSCALFRIDIVRYLHVTRFQEVSQWIPPLDS